MTTGLFITFEGIDGAGKSTQLDYAVNYLRSKEKKVIQTREPGGTPISEKVRNMILERRSNPAVPGKVWVLENGMPKLINVMIGVGDGSSTELIRGDLKEGQNLIIGIKRS